MEELKQLKACFQDGHSGYTTLNHFATVILKLITFYEGTGGDLRCTALQEAAEVMCPLCRAGNPVEWHETNDAGSGFIHREPWGWCRASSIHQLKLKR